MSDADDKTMACPRGRNGKELLIIAAALAGLSHPLFAQNPQVAFRDEFNQTQLANGWQIVKENPARHSLTARPGFLRVLTERGALEEDNQIDNLFLREFTGDFILETRLTFDPRAAQQFAGLLIYENQTNAAALGLTFVSGSRGEFRGLALVSAALTAQNIQPPVQRYDESNVSNPTVVTLRLLRIGEQLVAGYSENGIVFTDFGSIVNPFPDTVLVGIGATNGDFAECGVACDTAIPADFDFFQITALDDGGGSGSNDLVELTIDGPESVAAGESAVFQAEARFGDDSTQDVTDDAQWIVAPPGNGEMLDNVFEAGLVPSARFVTVVATYTSTAGVQSNTLTAAVLVEVVPPAAPGSGTNMCGNGLLLLIPFGLGTLGVLRLTGGAQAHRANPASFSFNAR